MSHYEGNSEEQRLRSFTGETIPFTVQSPSGVIPMQDLLLDVFNLMHNFIFFNEHQGDSLQTEVARTK